MTAKHSTEIREVTAYAAFVRCNGYEVDRKLFLKKIDAEAWIKSLGVE